jgi:hypothetical protein
MILGRDFLNLPMTPPPADDRSGWGVEAGSAKAGPTPLAYSEGRQTWNLKPINLAMFSGLGSAKTASIKFTVNIPDSRSRCKLSLVFVPISGTPPQSIVAKGLKLWLAEGEYDRQTTGLIIPCTNIEGTSAAPTPIPIDAGLSGYSREFVTSADCVQGVLTIPAQLGDGVPGLIQLQGRIQPEAVGLPWAEWLELRQAFTAFTPQMFTE